MNSDQASFTGGNKSDMNQISHLTNQIFPTSRTSLNRRFSGPTECLMDTLSSSQTLSNFCGASGPAGSVQLHVFHSNLETIQPRTTLPHKHYAVYSVESRSFNNDFVLICIQQHHPAAAVNTRGRCSRPAAGCCSLILQNVVPFSRSEAKSGLCMWATSKGNDSFSRCQCRNQI